MEPAINGFKIIVFYWAVDNFILRGLLLKGYNRYL